MKSQNTILRRGRAVSPVIATVILVAVTITVAVAVSYWMSGISSQYTSFEKVEIQTGYGTLVPSQGWDITLELKNTGTAPATLTHVFVNDVPVSLYGVTTGLASQSASYDAIETDIPVLGLPIKSGASDTVDVYIGIAYASLSSGTTVNIKIHSAGGMDYIKLVELV